MPTQSTVPTTNPSSSQVITLLTRASALLSEKKNKKKMPNKSVPVAIEFNPELAKESYLKALGFDSGKVRPSIMLDSSCLEEKYKYLYDRADQKDMGK